jgi:hypothetical protein
MLAGSLWRVHAGRGPACVDQAAWHALLTHSSIYPPDMRKCDPLQYLLSAFCLFGGGASAIAVHCLRLAEVGQQGTIGCCGHIRQKPHVDGRHRVLETGAHTPGKLFEQQAIVASSVFGSKAWFLHVKLFASCCERDEQ